MVDSAETFDSLKSKYLLLESEKHLLQIDFDTLKSEKQHLQTDFDLIKSEKHQLQANFDLIKDTWASEKNGYKGIISDLERTSRSLLEKSHALEEKNVSTEERLLHF